jgi:hypothetical protein
VIATVVVLAMAMRGDHVSHTLAITGWHGPAKGLAVGGNVAQMNIKLSLFSIRINSKFNSNLV